MPENPIHRVLATLRRQKMTTEQILPRVYDQLRTLAGTRLARLRPGQTLNATSLVHEAWLRLRQSNADFGWDHERHFFGAAARAMRHILVDRARHNHAEKRASERLRVPFSEDLVSIDEDETFGVLELDAALEKLAQVAPQKAEIVSLRFFGGLTVAEVADLLECSISTIEKDWRFIRAWLRTELRRQG